MANGHWLGVARRLGLALAWAAGAATPALAQRAEPCIGASWEMTGPLANNGAMLRIVVETALDRINAAGGVLGKPLKLVIYDDVGEPARAVDSATGTAVSRARKTGPARTGVSMGMPNSASRAPSRRVGGNQVLLCPHQQQMRPA